MRWEGRLEVAMEPSLDTSVTDSRAMNLRIVWEGKQKSHSMSRSRANWA